MLDMPTEYCEQLLQIGWEPVNTVSNLAFIVAGAAAFYALRKQSGVLRLVLPSLLILVGLGSGWWHAVHTQYGDIADTFSILTFAPVAGVLFLRKLLQSWKAVVLALAALLIAAFFAEQQPHLNGSLVYVVLLMGFIIGSVFYVKKFPDSSTLLVTAALTFGLAIIFRVIDTAICSEVIIGTHFLWHILMAAFGYQLILLIAKE